MKRIYVIKATFLFVLLFNSIGSAQTSEETVQYGYDNANQVQSADYDDGVGMPIDYNVNYSYDSSENRLARDVLTQQNSVANNPPGPFTLSYPPDTDTGVAYNVTLSWDAVTDPEGDPVVYDVYVGESGPPEDPELYKSSLSTNSLQVSLMYGVTYYWKVVARDNHNASTSSLVWSFTTTVDTDADGVDDVVDNCDLVYNPDQANLDGDPFGDVCDDDIDEDGRLNTEDNCIYTPNGPILGTCFGPNGVGVECTQTSECQAGEICNKQQEDNPDPEQPPIAPDGIGNVCDPDPDEDGLIAGDNCPYDYNPDQANMNNDGEGDACDDDIDGDVVPNASDNCDYLKNAQQYNYDPPGAPVPDEFGDQCDFDLDDDGVSNFEDNCPLHYNPLQTLNSAGLGDACWNVECIASGDATDLQTKLTAAQNNKMNDLIRLEKGTYSVVDNDNDNAPFSYSVTSNTGNPITREIYDLTIEGGYSTVSIECDTREINPSNTVLDGMISAPDQRSSKVFLITDLVDSKYEEWLGIARQSFIINGITVKNGQYGIDVYSSVGGIHLSEVIVEDNVGISNNGVKLFPINGWGTVENSIIRNNSANNNAGLRLLTITGVLLVTNNVIYGNSANSGGAGGLGITASGENSQIRIVNNTVVGNYAAISYDGGGVNISVSKSSSTLGLYNNIIWNNTASFGGDIYIASGAGVINAYNNDFTDKYGTFTNEANNKNNVPLFVDIGIGDYHLTAPSTLINAGTNETPYLPSTDFDGNTRIHDSTVDIGAYEFVGISVAPAFKDFGVLTLPGSDSQTFNVTNNGSTALSNIVVNLPSAPYSVPIDNCKAPAVVLPGTTCTFEVHFNPESSGIYHERIIVESNDIAGSFIPVYLEGIGNEPPVAVIAPITSVDEGQNAILDGRGSTDSDGTITQHEWDVDDDGSYEYSLGADLQNHVYPQDGLYTVRLRVTDDHGATGEITEQVTINDTVPNVAFTADLTSGPSILSVQFASLSTAYDMPMSWAWDFENDGTTVDTNENPQKDYSEGTYSVKLTVIDSDLSSVAFIITDYINVRAPENTLEVNKLGLGSGTVASSPAGIDCGVDCSEIYIGEPLITLSAVPNAGSEFAGWSGVVCEGGAQSAQSGGSELMISAPLFGGGGGTAQASSSSSMNTCDVSLDVSNTTSTTAIATFNLCANLPARVVGVSDHSTIQAAYGASPVVSTIQTHAAKFTESPNFDSTKTVILQGGYDCNYSAVSGITLIKGNLSITDGTVTVSDIAVE